MNYGAFLPSLVIIELEGNLETNSALSFHFMGWVKWKLVICPKSHSLTTSCLLPTLYVYVLNLLNPKYSLCEAWYLVYTVITIQLAACFTWGCEIEVEGEHNNHLWTSLLVEWIRIHLPMQRPWVQSMVWEDSICREELSSLSTTTVAHTAGPACCSYWSLCI